jgi:hypothetical protein
MPAGEYLIKRPSLLDVVTSACKESAAVCGCSLVGLGCNANLMKKRWMNEEMLSSRN